MEYLFRSRRLIWNVERYSLNEVPRLHTLKQEEGAWINAARGSLVRGDVSGFLSDYKRSIRYNSVCNDLRDKHIGKQIERAEQNIRSRYPTLRQKEPLRLTVCLGILHAPERYCQAEPIPLVGEPRDIGERLDQAIIAGKAGEEFDPFLLAYGIWSVFRVPEAALEKMNYQEIVEGVQEGRFRSEYETRKRQNLK